jgi:hypothetical protein
MRQFALGVLRKSPYDFGKMRIGHVLDAMAGYYDDRTERYRMHAELIRQSTTLLWNVQVTEEDRRKARDLWRFAWDEDYEGNAVIMEEEEVDRVINAQADFLNKHFPQN